MLSDLITALFLLLPIVIGGVLHMVVLTHGWAAVLKVPVYPRWFGANKTWHGFIIMPLVTIPGVFVAQGVEQMLSPTQMIGVTLMPYSPIVLGGILGMGYILFELPNSFVKRRLGIAPGETPAQYRLFFILLDQVDSAFGFVLAYYWVTDMSFSIALTMLLIFPGVALLVKRLLFIFKLKKNYT